ncbi:MAG: hypothetical protein EBW35_08720, partial [Rhodobacterales bacterium]|nr:hypothetical protein [Rhodobacterales bacterium]
MLPKMLPMYQGVKYLTFLLVENFLLNPLIPMEPLIFCYLAPAVACLSLSYALYKRYWIGRQEAGTPQMQAIAQRIAHGATPAIQRVRLAIACVRGRGKGLPHRAAHIARQPQGGGGAAIGQ